MFVVVETIVEHNTMLLENGYMDFILANHTAGKLTLFLFILIKQR
jgi:hypothetical protein